MNATRTISLAAFFILGLVEGRCAAGEAGAAPAGSALDLSQCHFKEARGDEANLILWVKARANEFIYAFVATPRGKLDEDKPEDYRSVVSCGNADGVSQKTGRGIGSGFTACIVRIEKEGAVFSYSAHWHHDENNGNLQEEILLPFGEAKETVRGRLTVASSFEWKKDIQDKAAGGDPAAQCRLAELYWQGKGFNASKRQAAKWFRRSAEQGWHDAQFMYAHLCANGYGVPKDPVEAYKWYAVCNEKNGAGGEDLRKRVSRDMTRKEIAEGEARAAEYLKRAKEGKWNEAVGSKQGSPPKR